MHDLTEARPFTEVVTAQEVYELGIKRGEEQERTAILKLLGAQELINDGASSDVLWTLRAMIRAGSHRKEWP